MDQQRFDNFTRAVGASISRRGVLKSMAAALFAGLVGSRSSDTDAAGVPWPPCFKRNPLSTGWSQTASNSFYIQSNTLQPNRYTDGDLATIESGLSDFTLQATVIPFNSGGNAGYPGLVFRYTDASNFWYVFADSGNSVVRVYSVIAGAQSERIRQPYTVTTGTSIAIRIDCKGNNIVLYINGIEMVTYVSTFNATATQTGVRVGLAGSPASPPIWVSLSIQPYRGITLNWPLFTEYASGPIVPLGAGGSWEDSDVNDPNVIYDSANSRWVLFYSGYEVGGGNVQALGLSYATALLGPWTKEVSNPVFTGGGSYGQNGGVIKKGSTYYYYYGTGGATTISCATSTNLTTWTDHGVVLTGNAGMWDNGGVFDSFARLRQDGNTIELWYGGSTGGGRAAGYATSTDGLTFTKNQHNPVFAPQGWAGSLATFGEPAIWVPPGKEGAEMLITFDSALGGSPNTRLISQGITIDGGTSWHWRISALEAQTYAWENHQVFDSFVMVDSGTMYLFHSGADQYGAALALDIQIGVATAPFPYSTLIST